MLNSLTHTRAETLKETLHHLRHATAYSQTLTQQLTLTLTQQYPNTTEHRHNIRSIDRCIRNHLQNIIRDMHEIYTGKRHTLYSNYYRMMIGSYRTRWGQITLNGKKHWVSEVLQPCLFLVMHKGNIGMASAVDIKNPLLIDAIREYALIYNPAPAVAKTPNVMVTQVNRAALQHYLQDINNNVVNRRVAKQVLNSIDAYDRLQQDIKQPMIDRTYLLGLNLQTASKDVRAAALAGQYAYDANCAVFGLFASVAHELSSKPYPTLLRYVHDRTSIRQQIADETGLSIDQVKHALISVGFGKRARGANDLAVVMTTEIGKLLVKEFRKASGIISKAFKQPEIKRAKQLAELFRTWESELMREFISQSNQSANLIIHDAVVFLKPVDIQHTMTKMQVSFTTHMEYFNFEETEL